MIVPNLMVRDIAKSVGFYRHVIGMEVMIYVTPDRQVLTGGDTEGHDLAFATLHLNQHQLMLQRSDSLASDVPEAVQAERPVFTGTVYFRDGNPDEVLKRAAPDQRIKGPATSWYGMRELYLTDPDGYVVCVAERDPSFAPG